jgi:hypothetical protein
LAMKSSRSFSSSTPVRKARISPLFPLKSARSPGSSSGTCVPLALPSRPIPRIVTSWPERCRPETPGWLAKHGIEYEHLDMLDLHSAEPPGRQDAHASFKASVHASDRGSLLFIESESDQTTSIARKSGEPVLDYGRKHFANPQPLTRAREVQRVRRVSESA